MKYDKLICTTHVPELNSIEKHENGVKFGASVTLNQIDDTLKNEIDQLQGKMVTQNSWKRNRNICRKYGFETMY